MNFQILALALASALVSFPVLTRDLSMVRRYAVIACQIGFAVSLALITPPDSTALMGTAVFSKYAADMLAWAIGVSADKGTVKAPVNELLAMVKEMRKTHA